MASLNAVIVPAKVLKGGRHKVRISVAHNSETRYIVTDITIDSAKEFKNGQITKRPDASYLNTKLRTLINKYQLAIDNIEFQNALSCSELVKIITSTKNVTTLQDLIGEFLNNYQSCDSSKMSLHWAFHLLLKVIPGYTPLKQIRNSDIMKVKNYMVHRKHSNNTINLRLSLISQLFRYAQANEYINPSTPFWNIGKMESTRRNSWLDVDTIKLIRDGDFSQPTSQVRNVFMLSFYLGGMNLVDIAKLINFESTTLTYIRQKTKRSSAFVSFDIPEEALKIIKELHSYKCMTSKNLNHYFHWHLIKIRKSLGIGNELIFYSARKSFAQIAFDLGVSTGVIDYILGHKPRSNGVSNCLYSYISVTPKMATDAIRKVLDFIK